MLVYGDHSERADTQERLGAIEEELARIGRLPPGLARHSALAGVLIETGRLLQGIADADFVLAGCDRSTPATTALTIFLCRLAQSVWRSWTSGFQADPALPSVPQLQRLPREVELKIPEGFAFYALYPEAYAEAAQRLTLVAPPRVIGIRSIGTTLSAIVAAALGAPPPTTFRPFGDPFARRIRVDSELERDLLKGDAHYIIADEGPGQSGSSFGAIADWLGKRGVPVERVAFMPSHSGPLGPQASEAHRERWKKAQRVVADFGPRLAELLSEWAAELLGPLDQPLIELSGGAWRASVYEDMRDWPAVNPAWERRKFLAEAKSDEVLLKFAGLGETGSRKLAMAKAHHAEGLASEPLGLVHGFLVERWHADARPLSPGEKPIKEIARYIAARLRLFPAAEDSGASLGDLLSMAQRNVGLSLGEDMAGLLDAWKPRLKSLNKRVARVRIDNRMDRHEWLRLPNGRLLKSDALDHHAGHDLIGCQDSGWDVAGAIVEFELEPDETADLIERVEGGSGRSIGSELLEFLTLAYLAFRVGQSSLGVPMCGGDQAEIERLADRADSYRAALEHHLLEPVNGTTWRKSSFDGRPERTGSGTNLYS